MTQIRWDLLRGLILSAAVLQAVALPACAARPAHRAHAARPAHHAGAQHNTVAHHAVAHHAAAHRPAAHLPAHRTHTVSRTHPRAAPHPAQAREPAPTRKDRLLRVTARPAHGAAHHASRPARAALPLIVIDPGHGGRDSGAIGITGTLEKTVDLAAARQIGQALEATGRYRVLLTRTGDSFVPLAQRRSFARAHGAALLISVHANASPDHAAHGANVYVRAGTAEQRTVRLGAPQDDPAGIAGALSGGDARPAHGAALLQYTLIDHLDDGIHMTPAPARTGHLVVLGDDGIPSVLVEMGFLSNRHDEALLKSRSYRTVVARAIREAVDDYFADLRHGGSART